MLLFRQPILGSGGALQLYVATRRATFTLGEICFAAQNVIFACGELYAPAARELLSSARAGRINAKFKMKNEN